MNILKRRRQTVIFYYFAFRKDGTIKFLTKGDNNNSDDRGLYPPGKLWLEKSDMVGRAKGYLPYIGMVTIVLNDYPIIKVCIMKLKWFSN